jgi:hypothetical protein
MTKTAMALVLYAAATAAYAGQPQQKLTVYVQNNAMVPGRLLIPAEGLASRMFDEIGICLVWREGKPTVETSQPPIFIELATATPATREPGALAFALPFEGRHLTVFFDRIAKLPYRDTVLAHVIVHEITHLLQGVVRHSATGVMKAHWSIGDFAAMRFRPFSFTPEDVDLIYAGLATRSETVTAATR